MRDRSFGVVTLAFMSVMVALYAQMGAIPLRERLEIPEGAR